MIWIYRNDTEDQARDHTKEKEESKRLLAFHNPKRRINGDTHRRLQLMDGNAATNNENPAT
jgi:hypothetical protein